MLDNVDGGTSTTENIDLASADSLGYAIHVHHSHPGAVIVAGTILWLVTFPVSVSV